MKLCRKQQRQQSFARHMCDLFGRKIINATALKSEELKTNIN